MTTEQYEKAVGMAKRFKRADRWLHALSEGPFVKLMDAIRSKYGEAIYHVFYDGLGDDLSVAHTILSYEKLEGHPYQVLSSEQFLRWLEIEVGRARAKEVLGEARRQIDEALNWEGIKKERPNVAISADRIQNQIWLYTLDNWDAVCEVIERWYGPKLGNGVHTWLYDIATMKHASPLYNAETLLRLEREEPEVFKVISDPAFYGRLKVHFSLEESQRGPYSETKIELKYDPEVYEFAKARQISRGAIPGLKDEVPVMIIMPLSHRFGFESVHLCAVTPEELTWLQRVKVNQALGESEEPAMKSIEFYLESAPISSQPEFEEVILKGLDWTRGFERLPLGTRPLSADKISQLTAEAEAEDKELVQVWVIWNEDEGGTDQYFIKAGPEELRELERRKVGLAMEGE